MMSKMMSPYDKRMLKFNRRRVITYDSGASSCSCESSNSDSLDSDKVKEKE